MAKTHTPRTKRRAIRRVTIDPRSVRIDNKPPKDWDLGYELVVSFHYGLDEEVISKIAGLRNYDTGCMLATMERDLMFPCGMNQMLAHNAASRLLAADHFGALKVRISYPVEHEGKDSFTPWYDASGKLIERLKHRKLSTLIVKRRKSRRGKLLKTVNVVRTKTRRADPKPKKARRKTIKIPVSMHS